MKILKLLNKTIISILIFFILLFSPLNADENKPIDIWNLEKKQKEIIKDNSISTESVNTSNQNSIYDLQANKEKDTIRVDKQFLSKEIQIVGLYDPEDFGLSIDMWSNSDGLKIKTLFENIDKFNLSKDASEIMHISLLTNAHYPNQNITEQEFIKYKSDWLIKNENLDIIEEYLIKNQIINLHPELTRYLVDSFLSESNIKKSCEIFSKNKQPIQDDYLSKFNLYCLINYGKNDEAQLILQKVVIC